MGTVFIQPPTTSDRSTVTDKTLWNYNMAGMILHFVQGMMMLIASQAVASIKNFKKEVTINYLEFDNKTMTLVSATKHAFDVEIGVAAAIFVLLSALAHGLVLLRWKSYIADINKGINHVRWYECCQFIHYDLFNSYIVRLLRSWFLNFNVCGQCCYEFIWIINGNDEPTRS